MKESYNEWCFRKCVKEGKTIHGVKNSEGVNYKWVATDGEEFYSDKYFPS